jgi:hypothetical protein
MMDGMDTADADGAGVRRGDVRRRFFIEIDGRAFDALAELALCERRGVREQAAVVLETALSRRTGERLPAAAEDRTGSGHRALAALATGSGGSA